MKSSFSFCGVNINELGFEYVPTLETTYVYGSETAQVSEQLYEGHDGGFFYGITRPPKKFSLRCMFEDSEIIKGNLELIYNFFKEGRTGKLVFSNRSWLYYYATVMSVSKPDLTNRKNGFITINLKAYYPYGLTDTKFMVNDGMDDEYIVGNSGILYEEITPPTKINVNKADYKNFLLYNYGTAPSHLSVKIQGTAGEDGITIKNKTNNTEMKLVAFTSAETTDSDLYIVCDSLSQKTVITNGTSSSNRFYSHDHGFITLEPAFPIKREVSINTTANQSTITGFHLFNDTMLGNYIYLENAWHKITNIYDSDTAAIDTAMMFSNYTSTNIVLMNEMELTVPNGSKIDSIEFLYKPTFM